jgi:methylated-DNA-protein-cysteine methyltransferase-like protein
VTPFQAAVHRVLSALEPGQVVTYGEVAAEAGYPGAARAVGTFLRDADGYAWWRVVRADGRLLPAKGAEQARRLAAEGVAVADGRVVRPRPRRARALGARR